MALIGQAVSEEKIFEIVMDNGPTDVGAWYTISSPCEPNGSGELIKLGYAEVYIFFLFLIQTIDCEYSLELPRQISADVQIYTISDFSSCFS